MSLATRMRGFVSAVLGPQVGALPWLGHRINAGGTSIAAPTTPAAALALTGVYFCCAEYANAISQSPPAIYEQNANGGRVRQVGTAASRALATLSQRDAEIFAWHCALSGNGFLKIVRNGTGAPAALVGVPAWRVSMFVDEKKRVFYRIAADKTVEEAELIVHESQMVHVRFRSVGANAYWGIPPAMTCSSALGLALASRDVQRVLFQNLSRPGGVLSAPGKIDKTVALQMQSQWESNFSGGGTGKVAVLSNGLEYQSVAFNAVDAQLLDTVKATVDDIANCYSIPANFISSQTHLTYASSSEATRSKYISALKPFAARCADALSVALLSANDRAAGAYVDYDLTSVLLPPGKEMAEFLSMLVGAGVLTPNEARNQYLNLEDHPDGNALRAAATPAPTKPTEPATP